MSSFRAEPTRFEDLVRIYRQRIPSDLHDLLLPDDSACGVFGAAIKRLRLIEEERNYVRGLQIRHHLPLRPNESVKRTMIRVRLSLLKKRVLGCEDGGPIDIEGPLPVDPLE